MADKGYHSKAVLFSLQLCGWRTYISEPDRGRQHWVGEEAARDAVYANRRRKRGRRGQALMRRRGEILERTFAHTLDSGGLRRMHVRGHTEVAKRALIQVAAFNLGLLMRKLFKVGKPRMLQGARAAIAAVLLAIVRILALLLRSSSRNIASRPTLCRSPAASVRCALARPAVAFATGC